VIRSNGQTGLGRGTRAKSLLASGSYGRRHVHRLCGPEAIQQAEVLHQCRRHGLDADAQRPQGQWQPGEATAEDAEEEDEDNEDEGTVEATVEATTEATTEATAEYEAEDEDEEDEDEAPADEDDAVESTEAPLSEADEVGSIIYFYLRQFLLI